MDGKIALEEHFAIDETLMDSAGFLGDAVWPELSAGGPYHDVDFYVARRTDDGYFWQEDGFHVGPTAHTADFGVAVPGGVGVLARQPPPGPAPRSFFKYY